MEFVSHRAVSQERKIMNVFSAKEFPMQIKLSSRVTAAIALAVCLGAAPAALPLLSAQDQSSAPQVAQEQSPDQAASAADPQQGGPPPGAPPPEFAQRGPTQRDLSLIHI